MEYGDTVTKYRQGVYLLEYLQGEIASIAALDSRQSSVSCIETRR